MIDIKLFIASDIHGSEHFCRIMAEKYKEEGADRLVLLGDILYHSPRNDLPHGYNPKGVIEILNSLKNEILCVKGNCDAYVDSMVLKFSVTAEMLMLFLDGKTVFATHGHIYNPQNMPPHKPGDILLGGHTHIPANEVIGDMLYINPGSVSIPKGESTNSYMIFDNGSFTLKNLL